MSCGRRIKKKRLKNQCNPFFRCHHNISCLQCRERDVNEENSENLLINNESSEITNNEKMHRAKSFLLARTFSEQQHNLMSVHNKSKPDPSNIKIRASKKLCSFIFSTLMIPLLIILLLNHVQLIDAFNLDIGTRVVFSQPPSTMFGFSVAGHKEGNVGW